MLQQTQVARVVDRWERFLHRYPTPKVCASAPLAEVLVEWQGLGYPRRARNLWRAAGECCERFGGAVPSDLGDLLSLPGVGPYTARAVQAFAFERDVGVVDTNIVRVLARVEGRRLTPAVAQRAADSWVPAGQGWAWNQALMDLGARHCRPEPRCDGCPLFERCAWATAGRPTPDPAVGSAGVSVRQAPFAGSDRQARGRILAVVGQRPLRRGELGSVTDREAAQALAVAEGLVADGLCHWRGGELHLGADDARVDCVGTDHVGTGQVGVGDVGVGESPRRSTRI
jgi:A/G-specific adenine glycosylase